jgi:adenylate kinase family enzyme
MLLERKRILVVGSGGAGKSTFARSLGGALDLPVIHLDRHFWKPGWQATPRGEWGVLVADLASRDEWIMDGNYGGSLALRLQRCDAVVFFDLPRLVCLWSVIKRRVAVGTRARPDMAPGCPERLSLEFVLWIWRYPRVSRPRILEAVAAVQSRVEVVKVSSRRDAERLLHECRATPAPLTAAH